MSKIYTKTTRVGKFYYADKARTIHHRKNGPAIEYADGTKEWYLNGKLHRSDGPAIECSMIGNGRKEWYLYGDLHRMNGPAIEDAYGRKEWYRYGKRLGEFGVYIADEVGGCEVIPCKISFKEKVSNLMKALKAFFEF